MVKFLNISEEDRQFLEKLYYKPDFPGSYTAPQTFLKAVKKYYPEKQFPKGLVTNFVKSLNIYNTNRGYSRKFNRAKYICSYIGYQHQLDLISYEQWYKVNNGFRYILVSIDCLSKFAKGIALKNKQPSTVIKGIEKMYENSSYPSMFMTDGGSEFTSNLSRNFYKRVGVKFFTSRNETKAAIVERFIKTIRTRIERNFRKIGRKDWLSFYQKFITAYNNGYHRGIKMAPAEVTPENQIQVFDNLMSNDKPITMITPKFKFRVGDAVKLLDSKKLFSRAYTSTWTAEYFIISKRYLRQNIPVYEIEDERGNEISGTFYSKELFKVKPQEDPSYEIEKVLKSKKIRGVEYLLIKWMNYNSSFNSWVKKDTVEDL